jgi:hypothetical protein
MVRMDVTLTGEEQRRIVRVLHHMPFAANPAVKLRSWVIGPNESAFTGGEVADVLNRLAIVIDHYVVTVEQERRDAEELRRMVNSFRALAGTDRLVPRDPGPENLDPDLRQRWEYGVTSRESL